MHSWQMHPNNNIINSYIKTQRQQSPPPCIHNKHIVHKHKEYICNWQACMHDKHIFPIYSKGWTMLWYQSMVSNITQKEQKLDTTKRERNSLCYHSVTPSSHTYPSNGPTRVNMRQEATIIGFNLSHLKEVESMERHHTYLPHQQ